MSNLANGQLAATATTILGASSGSPSSGRHNVSVILYNTSASSQETVSLTVSYNGSTARTIAHAVLAAKETLIVSNLPMDPADILAGIATDATTVDYVVTEAPGGPFSVVSLDANGAVKGSASGTAGNLSTAGSLTIGTTLTGPIGASTAGAGTTTADAGVLPAGTAFILPTTGANGTVGVRIDVADKVTGRVLYIGNGVSNAVLKIYAPSGGTINGAAGDAAYSTASGKGALVVCLSGSGNTWLAIG